MSSSPRQNFLKPPPVPDAPTDASPPFSFLKLSATAAETRKTVLEPSILTVPPAALRLEHPVGMRRGIARRTVTTADRMRAS